MATCLTMSVSASSAGFGDEKGRRRSSIRAVTIRSRRCGRSDRCVFAGAFALRPTAGADSGSPSGSALHCYPDEESSHPSSGMVQCPAASPARATCLPPRPLEKSVRSSGISRQLQRQLARCRATSAAARTSRDAQGKCRRRQDLHSIPTSRGRLCELTGAHGDGRSVWQSMAVALGLSTGIVALVGLSSSRGDTADPGDPGDPGE
jgi:hypothetical protein